MKTLIKNCRIISPGVDIPRGWIMMENDRIAALDTNEQGTWSSKIITVYGAKGGLGKTTIATNLALMLAKQKKKVIFNISDRNIDKTRE